MYNLWSITVALCDTLGGGGVPRKGQRHVRMGAHQKTNFLNLSKRLRTTKLSIGSLANNRSLSCMHTRLSLCWRIAGDMPHVVEPSAHSVDAISLLSITFNASKQTPPTNRRLVKARGASPRADHATKIVFPHMPHAPRIRDDNLVMYAAIKLNSQQPLCARACVFLIIICNLWLICSIHRGVTNCSWKQREPIPSTCVHLFRHSDNPVVGKKTLP